MTTAVIDTIFPNKNGVYLEPIKHQYWDANKNQYTSWSKFIKDFSEEFDAVGKSIARATRELKYEYRNEKYGPTKGQIQARAVQIQIEWKKYSSTRADVGSYIHKMTEHFRETGLYQIIDEYTGKLRECTYPERCCLDAIYQQYVAPYYAIRIEHIFFLEKDLLAGTCDHLGVRTNTVVPTIDFFDFKTNIKGLTRFSKYNNFFFPPIEHLEDCDFNKYALQLSMYAYMMSKTYGYKVGRLAVIQIRPDFTLEELPVPYMLYEIEALIERHRKLKFPI